MFNQAKLEREEIFFLIKMSIHMIQGVFSAKYCSFMWILFEVYIFWAFNWWLSCIFSVVICLSMKHLAVSVINLLVCVMLNKKHLYCNIPMWVSLFSVIMHSAHWLSFSLYIVHVVHEITLITTYIMGSG